MARGAKKLPGRWEIMLIAGSLVAIAVFMLLRRVGNPSGTAYISIDGRQVMSFALSGSPDRIISLREEYGVPADLEIRAGRVRFVNVTCPDHICEKTGFIFRDGECAVCMPNRTVVVVAE